MKSILILFISALVFSLVDASHDILVNRGLHHKRISMLGTSLSRRQAKKNCAARPERASPGGSSSSSSSSSASAAAASSSVTAASSESQGTANTANIIGGGSVRGMISVNEPRCGPTRATPRTSRRAGPNGDIDFFNCGLNSTSGWNPPRITLKDIVTVPLDRALRDPKSPYQKCRKHFWAFEIAGKEFGLPPMIIAAFALQESSCNENTIGGGGEQGLMQVTHDKCGGAPRGNCRDVLFNVRAGARYFRNLLDRYNGNLLQCIGGYNGWFVGMTARRAQAARYTSCCLCQNNLDYLHQFLNGWILNIDAYSNGLGTWHNLRVCPGRH